MNYADLSEAYPGSLLDNKITPEYNWSKDAPNKDLGYDDYMQKELHLQSYVEEGQTKEIPSSKCTTFQYHLQDCPACQEKLKGIISSEIYKKVDYNQYTGTSPPTDKPQIRGPIPDNPYDDQSWDRSQYKETRTTPARKEGPIITKDMWKLRNLHKNPVFWMIVVIVILAILMGCWFGWKYRASFMSDRQGASVDLQPIFSSQTE